MESPASSGALQPVRARALVGGASSGIGAALVRELVGRVYRVAAVARRSRELAELARSFPEGRVLVQPHDVHAVEEAPVLFEALVKELGGLDLLVYAAGIMPAVAPDEFDTEKDKEMLLVNTVGAIAWCNPAAEYFRSKRSGTIVGISSIAGDRGRKGNPVYGASKAALSHYLEALRNRLDDFGVHVCTIKPGPVATPMTAARGALPGMVSAESVARTIARIATRAQTRYVPLKWLGVSLVIRALPSFLFRRITI